MNSRSFIVTGGAGFIGSAVVRHLINHTPHRVCVLDKLTYAGNMDNLADVAEHPRFEFRHVDICDRSLVDQALDAVAPNVLMHLAAESHVDRSIDGPAPFITTNIVGTFTLLEAARQYWQRNAGGAQDRFRFHHVSTDEVYGSLGANEFFSETSPYRPNSPYSASKASSDHLARAWAKTYGLPLVTSNCSNNYGPYQFPEKLIPLTILNALEGRPLPVYGDGRNIRDWLYVDDHAEALVQIALTGNPGETYIVGGDCPRTNLDVVEGICGMVDAITPMSSIKRRELISFVTDRPGHDRRYAVDISKIRRDLGWSPRVSFEAGLRKTVQWYLDNTGWTNRVLSGEYKRARLGLGV